MAKIPSLSDIVNIVNSISIFNANWDAIQTAFTNTLSRDGSTPNNMEADLDMDSNDYPQYNQRSYSFKYFEDASTSTWYPDFTITITCELLEGGSACRRVQVGERVETIKTPEYVFVCK